MSIWTLNTYWNVYWCFEIGKTQQEILTVYRFNQARWEVLLAQGHPQVYSKIGTSILFFSAINPSYCVIFSSETAPGQQEYKT